MPGATADGDTAVVRPRLSAPIADTTEQTLEFWARDADNSDDETYMTRGVGALATQGNIGAGWHLYTYGGMAARGLAIVLEGADTGLPCRAPAGAAWQHYVITWNSLAVTCFVDGENIGTAPRRRGPDISSSLGMVFLEIDAPAALDELALFDRELSAAEVSAHYAAATEPSP